MYYTNILSVPLTHISFILKRISAAWPPAVEVGGPLPSEDAVGGRTALGGSEPLEALLEDGAVLAVVVGMHLHI